jgi:hypothetical protein
MFAIIKNFVSGLFYQNGAVFVPHVISVLFALLYAGVSIYLVYHNEFWASYDTFSYICGYGALGVPMVGHGINSWKNSPDEKMPDTKEGT